MMRQFRTINDPAKCNNDGICDYGEDSVSCENDCGKVSGTFCGNGLCEAAGTDLDADGNIDIDGENCANCPADCAGKQKGSVSKQFCCGFDDGNVTNPLICGSTADGSESCVDASNGRACRAGPVPLAECGDGLCEGAEVISSCANDCDPNGATTTTTTTTSTTSTTAPPTTTTTSTTTTTTSTTTTAGTTTTTTLLQCGNITNKSVCKSNAACQWKGNNCVNR
jgi:hypothetical protein